jgi:hypothetical protein
MSTKPPARHIRCAFCGAEAMLPSQRGPAPIYCSSAHRQAAYRQRRLERSRKLGSSTQVRNVRDELESLREVLREASEAPNWTAARRVLTRGLEENREQGGRAKS